MEMVGASQRTLSPHISQKKKNREKKQVPQDCGCDRQMPLQQHRVSTVHRQGKRLNGRPWRQRVGRGPSLGAPSNTGHGNGRERGRHVDGRPFSLVSCLLGRRPPKYVWPVPRAAKKRNNKNTEWMQNRYAPNGVVPAETGPAQPDVTTGGSPNAHAGRNPTDRPPPPAGQASGHRRATGRALRRCPPPHHHPSRRGGTSGAQWQRTVPPQPVPPGRPWNTTGQREPRWPDGQSHSRDGRCAPTRGAGRRRTRSRTTRPGQPAHASTNGTDQRH